MATQQEGYNPPVQQQVVYQQQAQPQQVVYVQPQQQGQPPQQVVYQQPAQGQQPQVVVVQPVPTQPILTHTRLPSKPAIVTCPHCKTNVQTNVRYENGAATWLACLGVFCLGGAFGCCLIPFCINDLKNAHHTCSQCGGYIGVRNAM